MKLVHVLYKLLQILDVVERLHQGVARVQFRLFTPRTASFTHNLLLVITLLFIQDVQNRVYDLPQRHQVYFLMRQTVCHVHVKNGDLLRFLIIFYVVSCQSVLADGKT